jgi:hypothetical protein
MHAACQAEGRGYLAYQGTSAVRAMPAGHEGSVTVAVKRPGLRYRRFVLGSSLRKPRVRGCKPSQFGSEIGLNGHTSFSLQLCSSGPVLTGLG